MFPMALQHFITQQTNYLQSHALTYFYCLHDVILSTFTIFFKSITFGNREKKTFNCHHVRCTLQLPIPKLKR